MLQILKRRRLVHEPILIYYKRIIETLRQQNIWEIKIVRIMKMNIIHTKHTQKDIFMMHIIAKLQDPSTFISFCYASLYPQTYPQRFFFCQLSDRTFQYLTHTAVYHSGRSSCRIDDPKSDTQKRCRQNGRDRACYTRTCTSFYHRIFQCIRNVTPGIYHQASQDIFFGCGSQVSGQL